MEAFAAGLTVNSVYTALAGLLNDFKTPIIHQHQIKSEYDELKKSLTRFEKRLKFASGLAAKAPDVHANSDIQDILNEIDQIISEIGEYTGNFIVKSSCGYCCSPILVNDTVGKLQGYTSDIKSFHNRVGDIIRLTAPYMPLSQGQNQSLLFDYNFSEEDQIKVGDAVTRYYSYPHTIQLPDNTPSTFRYAVRIFDNYSDDDKEQLEREVRILQGLKEYVVTATLPIDQRAESNRMFFLMVYMHNGSLYHLLDSYRTNTANRPDKLESQLHAWAGDTASAVTYLHDKRIVHRDLTSKHFLLDDTLTIKITGFQYAINVADNPTMADLNIVNDNHRAWLDPSFIPQDDDAPVDPQPDQAAAAPVVPQLDQAEIVKRLKARDVYSLSVILWEIVSLKDPYQEIPRPGANDQDENQLASRISQDLNLIRDNDTKRVYSLIISKCLFFAASGRLLELPAASGISQIIACAFLNHEQHSGFRYRYYKTKLSTNKLFTYLLCTSIVAAITLFGLSIWGVAECDEEKNRNISVPAQENSSFAIPAQSTPSDIEIGELNCSSYPPYNSTLVNQNADVANFLANPIGAYATFSSQNLTDDTAIALAETLATNNNVLYFGLATNFISYIGACAIACMLKTNSKIISVDLNGNAIGTLGASCIARALSNNTHSAVSELTLDANDITEGAGLDIGNMLALNDQLKRFTVGENNIRTGIIDIANGLSYNNALEYFVAHANTIPNNSSVGTALRNLLTSNTMLNELSLASNYMEDNVIPPLAEGIAANKVLRILNLNSNAFEDETIRTTSIEALANALEQASLQHLDLSYCEIGDIGAEKLATALSVNTWLKSISLFHNGIFSTGVRHILSAISGSNYALQSVNLQENDGYNATVGSIISGLMARNAEYPQFWSAHFSIAPCQNITLDPEAIWANNTLNQELFFNTTSIAGYLTDQVGNEINQFNSSQLQGSSLIFNWNCSNNTLRPALSLTASNSSLNTSNHAVAMLYLPGNETRLVNVTKETLEYYDECDTGRLVASSIGITACVITIFLCAIKLNSLYYEIQKNKQVLEPFRRSDSDIEKCLAPPAGIALPVTEANDSQGVTDQLLAHGSNGAAHDPALENLDLGPGSPNMFRSANTDRGEGDNAPLGVVSGTAAGSPAPSPTIQISSV